jgi:hypothetical protein
MQSSVETGHIVDVCVYLDTSLHVHDASNYVAALVLMFAAAT